MCSVHLCQMHLVCSMRSSWAQQQLVSVDVTCLVLPDSTTVASSACVCLSKGPPPACTHLQCTRARVGYNVAARIFCFCLVCWLLGRRCLGFGYYSTRARRAASVVDRGLLQFCWWDVGQLILICRGLHLCAPTQHSCMGARLLLVAAWEQDCCCVH
jgi:hypothetical protein